jgi:hypothetical protein
MYVDTYLQACQNTQREQHAILPIHNNTACPDPVSTLLLGGAEQIGGNGMELVDTAVQTKVLGHADSQSQE